MDPHLCFDTDLKELIQTKMQENHKVILMGDLNIPMNKKNKVTKMLCDLGLTKVITKKYKADDKQSMYKYGMTIIDGILTTDDVDFVQGGYEDQLSHS